MESFGVTGNGRLWAGGGSSSNGLSLCNKSAEKRERDLMDLPCLPPTNPLCSCKCVGEGQEKKWERETGTWIPLSLTVYSQPGTSPNLQPTYMHHALWTMHFTGRSLKPSLGLEHESPFLIACQQLQCRNPTKSVFFSLNPRINKRKSLQGMDRRII